MPSINVLTTSNKNEKTIRFRRRSSDRQAGRPVLVKKDSGSNSTVDDHLRAILNDICYFRFISMVVQPFSSVSSHRPRKKKKFRGENRQRNHRKTGRMISVPPVATPQDAWWTTASLAYSLSASPWIDPLLYIQRKQRHSSFSVSLFFCSPHRF